MTAVLRDRPPLAHPDAADADREPVTRSTPAVAYQRVIHQTVRREFRLLAGLPRGRPPTTPSAPAEITRHADLIARVLLQHHATERELLWPALFRSLPDPEAARDVVAEWTSRTALLDHHLRDLSTVARQWAVADTRRPATRSSAPAPGSRTTSTRPPPPRSATCSRWCRRTSRRRVARDHPHGRDDALRPRADAAARSRAGGRLRPRPGPPARRPLPRRAHRLAGLRRPRLPRGRRPAAGRSARRLNQPPCATPVQRGQRRSPAVRRSRQASATTSRRRSRRRRPVEAEGGGRPRVLLHRGRVPGTAGSRCSA